MWETLKNQFEHDRHPPDSLTVDDRQPVEIRHGVDVQKSIVVALEGEDNRDKKDKVMIHREG